MRFLSYLVPLYATFVNSGLFEILLRYFALGFVATVPFFVHYAIRRG